MTRLCSLLASLLVVKVTMTVLRGYVAYLPPDFNVDFLRGRESHFWSGYHLAFYTHIISGPLSLLLGLALVSSRLRKRFPAWHRRLGRVQAANTIFLVAPSGLWMAAHAQAGLIAGAGFMVLALLTATFTALGWQAARQRRYASHERWMLRSFALLSSAVVLRLMGGLAVVLETQAEWVDLVTAWASWLLPLLVLEVWFKVRGRTIFRRNVRSWNELASEQGTFDRRVRPSAEAVPAPFQAIGTRR